jgi:G3E family GTPase
MALARHQTGKGQRVAFLVNDAGEVQIDGTVIRAGGHEVVEIFTGCLGLMREDPHRERQWIMPNLPLSSVI